MREEWKEKPKEDIIYGINPVDEALNSAKAEIEKIYVSQTMSMGRIGGILRRARERGIPVSNVPHELLRKISGTPKNQGIAAMISAGRYVSRDEVLQAAGEDGFVLILDGVEDPGNFGAIIRSAVATGASGIFIPVKGSVGMTSVVAKRSAGSIVHAKIARERSLLSLINSLKERGFCIVAVEKEGSESIFHATFRFPLALLLGGEGKGVRRDLLEKADSVINIPIDRKVESLNVSVACGIALYEVLRRRSK